MLGELCDPTVRLRSVYIWASSLTSSYLCSQFVLNSHISLHVPPITRDTLFHAYGSDCLFENGKILVMGTSIHDWPAPDNSAGASCIAASAGAKAQAQTTATAAASKPWLSTGWFLDRMVLHEFKAIAQVLGPSTAKVCEF
jgi:hypothetical protein